MMKRIMKMIPVLFILFGVLAQTPAQDAQDTEEGTFVQNLLRYLVRSNWETSEAGALERHLLMYEWENLSGVDPGIVAQALSYGKDRGIQTPGELAEIAHQLSLSVREMQGLGLETRDMLRASMNAVRTVATVRLEMRDGEQIPDVAQTFRDQIRRQITGAEQSSLRRQANRRGSGAARPDTWSPPAPEERAGGGGSNLPSGPGKPSGSASEYAGGNGGR